MLVPTTCFNCESACGLLAYVDKDSLEIRKLEGNPEHPASRGRNCAKGPATLNQIHDPHRILYPLKRDGARGEGKWRQVGWDEALDDIALAYPAGRSPEGRRNEVVYHVGRPGEDGYTERVLAAWGLDGHNSHTNICSSNGRAGYHYWMGFDRPSPDYANADVILLISAHLESGHYFNPHAQRIVEAKQRGAKLIVFDVRLSNTATHADYWVSPYPGTEPAILLAIAGHLIRQRRYDREFVRRWWNWREYLRARHPGGRETFERFEAELAREYESYTFEFAAKESGIDAETIAEVAEIVARAGHATGDAHVAERRGGKPGRLAGVAHALPAERAPRRDRHGRGHASQRRQQVRAAPDPRSRASAGVERPQLAGRIPAGDERDVDAVAASSEGRARTARCIFLARLQPGLDQSRRLHLDRGAHRREARRPSRRADADVERDGILRGLRAADGPRCRTTRHPFLRNPRRTVARLPTTRTARGSRAAR